MNWVAKLLFQEALLLYYDCVHCMHTSMPFLHSEAFANPRKKKPERFLRARPLRGTQSGTVGLSFLSKYIVLYCDIYFSDLQLGLSWIPCVLREIPRLIPVREIVSTCTRNKVGEMAMDISFLFTSLSNDCNI